MKNKLVKVVRTLLPRPIIFSLEQFYRITRILIVSAYYGFPARRLSVIAVTGTNGKTTTVNYINEILKADGKKTAMFSTVSVELAGVSIPNDMNVTVANVRYMQRFFRDAKRAKVDYVVLEVTSHALDQYKLWLVPVMVAVMTNLTQDHLDYHKTMEAYAQAKSRLFRGRPRYIVLNSDDAWFDYFNQFDAAEKKITYGMAPMAMMKIEAASTKETGGVARLVYDDTLLVALRTSLPGLYNIYNATAAASVGHLLGIKSTTLIRGISNLKAVTGRYQFVPNDRGYKIIVDYAHTPDAFEKLLGTVKDTNSGKVILVFGATGDRDKTKRPIMGSIAAHYCDYIVLTDEESYNENPDRIRSDIRHGIEGSFEKIEFVEIADRYEAMKHALKRARKGDVVAITGMGHEQFRVINGERHPWNDVDIVKKLLKQLN